MGFLIFITHPSVVVDPKKDQDQWSLSKEGIAESERLLKMPFWKRVTKIYSSNEVKSRTVAELAEQRLQIPLEKLDSLGEIDRKSTGFLDSQEYNYAIEDFYIHPHDSYKGWETAHEATQRIKSAVEQIFATDPNATVAIVGHGIIGSCLACHIKGIDPTFNEDNAICASYFEIDWTDKKIIEDWKRY
jgi:broad specificity phosphatase PhoE